MKVLFNTLFLFLLLFTGNFNAQSSYSLGLTVGPGVNIYKNSLSTDKNHFKPNSPFSLSLGAKLVKNLDEENKLFADLLYTRKKIEYEYNINEPEIPFINKEKVGQKYDCISLYVGYRRLFPMNTSLVYIEASIGADYNNNVMSYNEGNGEAQEGIRETIYFENFYNTNLGEKSYTISTNIGFGLNFGTRSQYDIGLSLNIPIQKIQSQESHYQYTWNYSNKNYVHQLSYLGNIYYPNLRLTYYFF
ncbi:MULTISPECIES: hypothetical protein [Chryseobacterium]|uniref:Outer membrane protein beta-barrel domain-containing protein n=1 Tax=Chryseobacterium camelliae TaxID=1265445 RepID=A0ABU0TMV8_9FLAO|nr:MULTISPECIES: hypothetical protein [Chryseobacterium]MDT3407814.1 hypothetical protein [Pseudacidovorax intermedius]MDQ1098331.1 hypothetical protein [Chryseobacterium camelliae]MDQ1102256.1 hypothetical protein [Chryseobacterium sp. SORGH_AS_1048]MDR6085694.1 hypothetical protein [Chryseobacterium sp. SORGH_AS_0909]MDR6130060.1 hypothetical protein [Chryseobacterium sp. SORGH_AS_1175]